ncbi:MAG: type II toxin-antitoxin system VapC family toxin [Gemmataceae bacterium]|nr:type II toxin-antitoxin system VapC family toxin [Gemmataceae bacterium]
MSFLVEADTCMACIRQVPLVVNRFAQYRGDISISVLSITGLELWLLRPRTPSRYLQPYHALLQQLTVLEVDEEAAHRAASVGGWLAVRGHHVGTVDLLIAATALVRNLTLVTHDVRPFASIPGLTMIDWLTP